MHHPRYPSDLAPIRRGAQQPGKVPVIYQRLLTSQPFTERRVYSPPGRGPPFPHRAQAQRDAAPAR